MITREMQYDLLVIGGGPGGIASAITAARQGMKVLIADRNGCLGGNMSLGLPFLGFFDCKGRRIVGGFADELVQRMVKFGCSEGHRICPKHNSLVTYEPDRVKVLLSDMCREAGVDVLLHCELIAVEHDERTIHRAILAGRGSRVVVSAKYFIDTGDGDITCLAGGEFLKGDPNGHMQPPSVLLTINGIDDEKFFRFLEENPDELGHGESHTGLAYNVNYFRASRNFCFVGLGKLYNKLKPLGKWPMEIWAVIMVFTPKPGQIIINGPRQGGVDSTDLVALTNAERKGQKEALALVEMLREYVPGFEHCFLSNIPAHIGIRETRRVLGTKYLTVDDIQGGSVPEDSIALGGYPIDIHGKDDTSKFIPVTDPYGVPYQCLTSKSFDNLLAAGKCISVDAFVHGSTRVIAQCLAVGEAAGVGAALAFKQGKRPCDVDVNEVREILLKNGAILKVDDNDVLRDPALVYGE